MTQHFNYRPVTSMVVTWWLVTFLPYELFLWHVCDGARWDHVLLMHKRNNISQQ